VYRISWLLWLVFALGFFFLAPHGREAFFALLAGRLQLHTPLCNLFEGLIFSSVIIGWLLQAVAVVILSWWREKSKREH